MRYKNQKYALRAFLGGHNLYESWDLKLTTREPLTFILRPRNWFDRQNSPSVWSLPGFWLKIYDHEPIRGQYPGHVTTLSQWEAYPSIAICLQTASQTTEVTKRTVSKVTWSLPANESPAPESAHPWPPESPESSALQGDWYLLWEHF